MLQVIGLVDFDVWQGAFIACRAGLQEVQSGTSGQNLKLQLQTEFLLWENLSSATMKPFHG